MERDEIERLVTGLDADQLRRLLGRVQRALGDAAPAATPPGLRLTNVGDAPLTVEREPGRPERLAPGESTTVAPGDVAADRAAGEADAAHPLAAERIRSLLTVRVAVADGEGRLALDVAALRAGAARLGTVHLLAGEWQPGEAGSRRPGWRELAGHRAELALRAGCPVDIVAVGRGIRLDLAGMAATLFPPAAGGRTEAR